MLWVRYVALVVVLLALAGVVARWPYLWPAATLMVTAALPCYVIIVRRGKGE